MARTTIMLVGLGELGGHVLEMLVRAPGNRRILTADVDEDRAYRKTQIAIYGASQMGYNPDVEFTKIDLNNKEQSAEVINRVNPDVIYSAATLQSWWVITTLPKPVFDDLDKARFGPWLPMHLSVVYKLMQAVKATDHSLLFLALDGDQIAGFNLCRPLADDDSEMGWVGSLGVLRPWRESAALGWPCCVTRSMNFIAEANVKWALASMPKI